MVYRQPDDSSHGHPSTCKEFSEILNKLKDTFDTFAGDVLPEIFLLGDFNLPHASWPNGSPTKGASKDEKQCLSLLQELSNEFTLQQCICKETHKCGNILDLVWTNNLDLIHSYSCIPTNTDITHHSSVNINIHKAIITKTETTNRTPNNPFERFNFYHETIDWEGIRKELSEFDWEKEFLQLNSEEKFEKLLLLCEKTTEKFVPIRKPYSSKTKNKRIPRDRRILMRRRSKLEKKYILEKNSSQMEKIKSQLISIEKQLQISYKKSASAAEKKACEAIKMNPKYFYSYAKRHSKTKTRIGPLFDKTKNDYVSNSKEMADILQKQYQSVFSSPKENQNQIIHDNEDSIPILNDIDFTKSDFVEAIKTISNNAAPGPDGFSAVFLKNCSEELATPFYAIWRECFDKGTTPEIFKESYIIPIYKGGDQGEAQNYRPVSLTSHIMKTFEKIVRKNIVDFLEENHLFNDSQHGFRQGRSCLSQLLEHFDTILTFVEQGKNVDTIYLDFSKAFDKVDHTLLLNKLKHFGIRGKVLKWIESFLRDRKQSVIIDGSKSESAPVVSGVPQGSVLGPILFLLMISDIDENVKYSILASFADDTRVLKEIEGIIDTFKLQHDLNEVYDWTGKNNMNLNSCKFEHMKYGKDVEMKKLSTFFTNDNTIIESKTSVKDLGVWMSSDCSFTDHINKLLLKTKDISSWILRTFSTRERDVMITLWKSLVLPHLDYCSQLWSPSTIYQIEQIESVQRNFFKKIKGLSTLDYWEQLRTLKMYSLQRRRERYRIIYIWSILEGLVPNFNHLEEGNVLKGGVSSTDSSRHGRKCTLRTIERSSFRKAICESLAVQGPKLFNSLPSKIRNTTGCSKEGFKKCLDNYLSTIPDEPHTSSARRTRMAESNSLYDQIIRVGLNELDR